MKNTSKLAIAAVLVLTAISGAASAAPEASSFPRVSLLAGPDSDYPVIAYIPRGTPAEISGCLSNGEWCAISSGMDRGWVAKSELRGLTGSHEIAMVADGRMSAVPVVSYDESEYRNMRYRARSAYGSEADWHPVERNRR